MNAEECNERAEICAKNAASASNELISGEFLKTAAQWRAMAIREIFLGFVDEPQSDTLEVLTALSEKPL